MLNRKKGESSPLITKCFRRWKVGGNKIQIPSIYEGKIGGPLSDNLFLPHYHLELKLINRLLMRACDTFSNRFTKYQTSKKPASERPSVMGHRANTMLNFMDAFEVLNVSFCPIRLHTP